MRRELDADRTRESIGLSSVPAVGRGHAGNHRHETPQAAAIGATTSDVLSPTPPVLCLSTFSRDGRKVQTVPESRISRGGKRFALYHAAKVNGHQSADM